MQESLWCSHIYILITLMHGVFQGFDVLGRIKHLSDGDFTNYFDINEEFKNKYIGLTVMRQRYKHVVSNIYKDNEQDCILSGEDKASGCLSLEALEVRM